MRIVFRHWILAMLGIVAFVGMTASMASAQFLSASKSQLINLGHGMTVRVERAKVISVHTMRLQALARTVPAFSAMRGPGRIGIIPFRTRFTARQWSAIKAAASHNRLAPFDNRAGFQPFLSAGTPEPLLRATGITDSGIICSYFGTGCEPPDMAMAASPDWVVQVVNTSIGIYDKHGVMVLGFPIDAPTFFGIPNPGSCTPFGVPFTSDPRAFWDPNDHRFFLSIAALNGVVDTCPLSTSVYVAVSQTSDPTGLWNVYAFPGDPLAVGGAPDFPQLGFDANTLYVGTNLYAFTSGSFTTCPTGYCWAQTIAADKHAMEAGAVPTANLFFDYLNSSGFPLDTVQPVETVANLAQQPGATPLIASDNLFGTTGFGCFPAPCNTLYIFGISNPLSISPTVSAKTVTSPGYTYPPPGDEPGCPACMETIDVRITGMPVYSPYKGGTISFALDTGVAIGTLVWPANLWGEVGITTGGGKITSASFAQGGYIDSPGVTNSFADTMLTPSGKLFVVSDVMSSTVYPSWVYRVHKPSDPAGTLEAPRLVQPGLDSFFPFFGIPGFGNLRWGDYEAASYTGFADNSVWIASQYPNTDYDWATSMAKVK